MVARQGWDGGETGGETGGDTGGDTGSETGSETSHLVKFSLPDIFRQLMIPLYHSIPSVVKIPRINKTSLLEKISLLKIRAHGRFFISSFTEKSMQIALQVFYLIFQNILICVCKQTYEPTTRMVPVLCSEMPDKLITLKFLNFKFTEEVLRNVNNTTKAYPLPPFFELISNPPGIVCLPFIKFSSIKSLDIPIESELCFHTFIHPWRQIDWGNECKFTFSAELLFVSITP